MAKPKAQPLIVRINEKIGHNGSSFDISKTKGPLEGSGKAVVERIKNPKGKK